MDGWIAPKVGDLVRYRGTGAVYLVSYVTRCNTYVRLVTHGDKLFNVNSAALDVINASSVI